MAREYQATVRHRGHHAPLRKITFDKAPSPKLRALLKQTYAEVDDDLIFQQRDVSNWTPMKEADDA